MRNEIVAFIVSNPAGDYVSRHKTKAQAIKAGGRREGWAIGVELRDGSVTFEC